MAGVLPAQEFIFFGCRLWAGLLTLRDHQGCVLAVTFSPDGTMLATASADKTIQRWDVIRVKANQ